MLSPLKNDSDEFKKLVAKKLKFLRKQAKITQKEFADQVGLDYRHYQNIETAKANFRLSTIEQISRYYHMTLAEFMGGCGLEELFVPKYSPKSIIEKIPNAGELIEKPTELARYIEDLPLAVAIFDRNGQLVLANQRWVDQWQISKRKFKKLKAWDLMGSDQEFWKSYYQYIIENTPEPVSKFTNTHQKGDEYNGIAKLDWDYIRDDNQNVKGILVLSWRLL